MPEKKRFGRKARTGIAATAVAAVVLAGIYVTLAGQGNDGVDAVCMAAKADAAALDPLIRGEVAAFQLAGEPDRLSGLAFTGVDGKPMTLAAFKGKVALVNLWATWCGPCREEMPALDRLEAALGGQEFAVIPVSIDIGDPERPKAFLEKAGVKNLPLYTDRTMKIFEDVKAKGLALGLPVTMLLDRNGCRLGHINGPAKWDSEEGKALIQAAIGPARAGS